VLEKLKFEAQTGGGQPEIFRVDLYDWGPSDVGPDQPLSFSDIVLIDDAFSLGIHISTRHNGHTNVLKAANLGSKELAVDIVVSAPGDRGAAIDSEAVPVTNAESSEGRYSTERASSSGLATRFSAWRLVMNACLSAVSFIARYIPVSTAPGRIALTRMPRGSKLDRERLRQTDQAGFTRGIGGDLRKSEAVADESRGEDHRPAATLQHRGDLVLCAEERPGEVDGDGIVPPGLGHIRAWAGLTERAGIVESDIEPAEILGGEGDQGLCVSFRAHVPRQCDGMPAVGLDLGDQACKLGFTPGTDDQLRPFCRK